MNAGIGDLVAAIDSLLASDLRGTVQIPNRRRELHPMKRLPSR